MTEEALNCENLRHRLTTSGESPYRCGEAVTKYEVAGDSFTAIVVLCETHKKAAEAEGFKLKVAA